MPLPTSLNPQHGGGQEKELRPAVYACPNCRHESSQHLVECPECGHFDLFHEVRPAVRVASEALATIHTCQNCGYLSGYPLTECPGCGRLNSFDGTRATARALNQIQSPPTVYTCANPTCNYETSEKLAKCPGCGRRAFRTEEEMRAINLVFGIMFTAIGVGLLGVGVAVIIADSVREPQFQSKPGAYWMIFGIGLVFLVGGISSIKGSNWLIRVIISFSR
jgi:predicted ATP-dependent serine protease